jgi:hypothetical protein
LGLNYLKTLSKVFFIIKAMAVQFKDKTKGVGLNYNVEKLRQRSLRLLVERSSTNTVFDLNVCYLQNLSRFKTSLGAMLAMRKKKLQISELVAYHQTTLQNI